MTVKLEQLEPGSRIYGISADGPVIVIGVTPYGAGSAVKVVFEVEATGRTGSRILYRSDESSLQLLDTIKGWTFDGEGRLFRLVMEAERLRLAHQFDPQLAVSVSRVEPLPHQIAAVYDTMLARQPLRFLLADDPGAGKTIMTGLLIKELLLRADIERCLIVVPAALDVQWQDELRDKFGLHFTLLGREQIQGALGNAFDEHDLIIGRIDLLKQDDYIERLAATSWDLVVVDEAHKLSATYLPGPNEIKETARYRLGRVLSQRTRHFLLLTATPHRGKQADFELLLALLDPDRFSGRPRTESPTASVLLQTQDLMRRMLKEDLVDFDGRPLFPERFAQTVSYTMSDQELALYDAVTRYVRQEMTRADQLANQGSEGRRRRAVIGFALTVLQRRLASSPEAILRSLERRRARLAATLEELRRQRTSSAPIVDQAGIDGPRPTQLRFDLDLGIPMKGKLDVEELELDLEERPENETEEIVDRASAARSLADLEREVSLLAELEDQARQLHAANVDAKWRQLSALLSDPKMFDEHGRRQKLVIFTEHRDTLGYLVNRIRSHLGQDEEVAFIHGGLSREERQREQAKFVGDDPDLPEATILVATDAAGEGINLQVAHLMINYDLPWNPNRLEQRFGRIHRFGQRHTCFTWNLVAANTREGDVYRTLLDKLNEARDALGGKVFDVLGQLFTDRPLRDLLLAAIREEDPWQAARIERDVESLVSLERYREIVERQALAKEALGPEQLKAIRAERERAEIGRLVPHFIAGFFVEAFREIGGTIEEREPGRYAVLKVPLDLRRRGRRANPGIAEQYARICFDKARLRYGAGAAGDGRGVLGRDRRETKEAMLVAPGHPLFDLTLDLLLERHGDLLRHGAVLLDPRPGADTPRVLVCIRSEITDERIDPKGGHRLASAELRFIEVTPNGETRDAGAAPYLDYRPLDEDERTIIAPLLAESWVIQATEMAEAYAVEHLMPSHRERIKREREELVLRARKAIDDRLTAELFRLTDEIEVLRREAQEGRQPKANVDRKVREYEDLKERRERRLQELDRELNLTPLPPRAVTAALVVPAALLAALRGDKEEAERARVTRRIDELAIREVIRREREAGYFVRDVSAENRGYDIESSDPNTGTLRLIEVKGRDVRGATIVLTRNEYLCALNKRSNYILVIVQVEGEAIRAYHAVPDPLGRTTEEGLPFGLESTTFAIADLVAGGSTN